MWQCEDELKCSRKYSVSKKKGLRILVNTDLPSWHRFFLFVLLSVREKIGPIATPDFIQNAPALPKTRSGNHLFTVTDTNIILLLSHHIITFSSPTDHLRREDHEAYLASDCTQRQRPGRPFDPGRPQSGGGALQPEMWSCGLNTSPPLRPSLSVYLSKLYMTRVQMKTITECLWALFWD